ncbi:hypothetical protein [Citrobacter sedlakii]|uniref:hypothetical protein n=1 Tax=Citrobacter sedlakii TaxID=67826 RepID=UPI001BADDA51|nr:hypothetical protein [Citrobacter sedlakii]EKJ8218071.1 hypothetical protein [Citrobacter sedlakii]QUC29786.1 hypothetical protein JY391_20125 [Citrobacter sedlakii]
MLATLLDDAEGSFVNGLKVRFHLRRGHWHGFWFGRKYDSEDRIFRIAGCRHKLFAADEMKVLFTDSGLPCL